MGGSLSAFDSISFLSSYSTWFRLATVVWLMVGTVFVGGLLFLPIATPDVAISKEAHFDSSVMRQRCFRIDDR